MAATVIDGKAVAAGVRAEVAQGAAAFEAGFFQHFPLLQPVDQVVTLYGAADFGRSAFVGQEYQTELVPGAVPSCAPVKSPQGEILLMLYYQREQDLLSDKQVS